MLPWPVRSCDRLGTVVRPTTVLLLTAFGAGRVRVRVRVRVRDAAVLPRGVLDRS